MEQYETALRLQPDYPEAAFNLGNALSDTGETERAISSYRLALRLRPGYAEADLNLGLALSGRGKSEEAVAAFRAALRRSPRLCPGPRQSRPFAAFARPDEGGGGGIRGGLADPLNRPRWYYLGTTPWTLSPVGANVSSPHPYVLPSERLTKNFPRRSAGTAPVEHPHRLQWLGSKSPGGTPRAGRCFNLEPVHDFMPPDGGRWWSFSPLTVVVEPSNPAHPKRQSQPCGRSIGPLWGPCPVPRSVVVQDLDKPGFPAPRRFLQGEVNSTIHRALGCVGTVVDGAIRDTDEMNYAGFKALARSTCVGHAFSTPVRWNCPVEVFGCKVEPGQLIHADKHGFLAVPIEDELKVLAAARFMDSNECQTMIPAAREGLGKPPAEVLASFDRAAAQFRAASGQQFGKKGEW